MGESAEPARSDVVVSGEAPAPLDNLSPAIIPLREFPLRKWYYVNPLWYYHAPALEHRLRRNERFFELVDPAQRELCRLALEAGLCTTPSCQGHFYPQDRFEQIWAQLVEHEAQIRNVGLLLEGLRNGSSALVPRQ